MREIQLTKGYVAIVDDADYEFLSNFKWFINTPPGYACRSERTNKYRKVSMQNDLLNPPDGYLVDHINGDKLDNRRSNLRICTSAQNARNRSKTPGTSSKYKGVTYIEKASNNWKAQIGLGGRRIVYLGYFDSEIEAARAYDAAALLHFGEFAKLNFPERQG